MHLESVSISGFRGIEEGIPVSEPLGIIAGPNNAGKSALIDAVRAVLYPFADQQGQKWITRSDFTRLTSAHAIPSDIAITLHFANISDADRGRFISILSPLNGEGAGRLTLRASYTASGRIKTRYFGGDFDQNDVEYIARENIRFIYLPALRDASGDLRPGQNNRVANLVSVQADQQDKEKLTDIIQKANEKILGVSSITKSSSAVQERLNGMTGDGPFTHKTEFGVAEPKFENIIASLQVLMGVSSPAQLFESGLGYNNLLYISVVLSALETSEDGALNLLLIEEPEAHLHPQLQTLLMNYLENLSVSGVQVLATTHSSQFTSTTNVEKVTVLSRDNTTSAVTARDLSNAPLTRKEFAHLRRFLDITKSTMLFAQGVILVEGIAEQLLMSLLAKQEGVSLSDHGITVVSVDGLAFRPFMNMFDPAALPHRCLVVTDGDPSQSSLDDFIPSTTAQQLKQSESPQRKVSVARKTFEWDLAYDNFSEASPRITDNHPLVEALKAIRPQVGRQIEQSIKNDSYNSAQEFANAFLEAVEPAKGPFAQELSIVLERDEAPRIQVPQYLSQGYTWVVGHE